MQAACTYLGTLCAPSFLQMLSVSCCPRILHSLIHRLIVMPVLHCFAGYWARLNFKTIWTPMTPDLSNGCCKVSYAAGNTIESSHDIFLTLLEQSDLFDALRENILTSMSESPSAILCRGDPTAFSPCALGFGQFPTVPGLNSTSTYYLLLTNLNTDRKLAIVYSPRNAGQSPAKLAGLRLLVDLNMCTSYCIPCVVHAADST